MTKFIVNSDKPMVVVEDRPQFIRIGSTLLSVDSIHRVSASHQGMVTVSDKNGAVWRTEVNGIEEACKLLEPCGIVVLEEKDIYD